MVTHRTDRSGSPLDREISIAKWTIKVNIHLFYESWSLIELHWFLFPGHDVSIHIFQNIFELGIIEEGEAVLDDFFVEGAGRG